MPKVRGLCAVIVAIAVLVDAEIPLLARDSAFES
jgi:hypothetical protein